MSQLCLDFPPRIAAARRRTPRQVEVLPPEPHACPVCAARGRDTQADVAFPVYDPTTGRPMGLLFLCAGHVNATGSPMVGFFTCDICRRVFPERYGEALCGFFDEEVGAMVCPVCRLAYAIPPGVVKVAA